MLLFAQSTEEKTTYASMCTSNDATCKSKNKENPIHLNGCGSLSSYFHYYTVAQLKRSKRKTEILIARWEITLSLWLHWKAIMYKCRGPQMELYSRHPQAKKIVENTTHTTIATATTKTARILIIIIKTHVYTSTSVVCRFNNVSGDATNQPIACKLVGHFVNV